MQVAQGRRRLSFGEWVGLASRGYYSRLKFIAGRLRWAQWLLVAAISLIAGPSYADVQYAYDAAGRLIQAVAPDGASAIYRYDSAGNVTTIERVAAGQLAIAGTGAGNATPGTQITIDGSGFSTNPGDDVVTFNGVAGTVISATANQLVVLVPVGATTGPISVSVGGQTIATNQVVVVPPGPTISDFSPKLVDVGTTVTVSGTNLNPISGTTSVVVGGGSVHTTSIASASIAFVAQRSGAITVTTAYGQATTASDLIAVPTSIGAANVLSSAAVAPGGAAQSLSVNQQNKYGLFSFDATQGQYLSLQVASLTTTPTGGSVSYQIFSPTNTSLVSGSISAAAMTIDVPKIPTTGTYLIVFTWTGGTFQLAGTLENNVAAGPDGLTRVIATTGAAQWKRFTFLGAAGQSVGLGVTGLTFTPSTTSAATLYVYKPDGSYLNSVSCNTSSPGGGCQLALTNLPVSGTYTVKLVPPGQQVMNLNFTASQDVTGTLALNSAQGVTLVPGQDTWLDFTATAGQTVAVSANTIVTSPANQNVTLTVYNASGASVGTITNATGSLTVNLTNLAAGTYHVLVMPYYAASATLQVTLGAGTGAALGMDGSTAHYTASVPGEIGYFTFAGVAGQSVGLGVTGLTFTPSTTSSASLYVYKPDNTYLNSTSCYTASPGGGCQLALTNLPVSGTYMVKLTPPGQQVMTFNFTASQDVTGSLALNSAQGVTLVPGQDTWFDFTATAGQTVAVTAGSIVTSPASQNVTLTVYNASGASVGTITNATGSLTVNLTNLAAGTYHVLIVPYYAASATLQVTLGAGTGAALGMDGTTGSYTASVPGEIGYFTFAGVAGQSVGLGVTGLTFTPSTTSSASLYVYKPDNTYLNSASCYTASPGGGCQLALTNLPVSGTYTVKLTPPGQQVMNFNFTASQDVTGTLALNSAQGVTLVPGQDTWLDFTATAGQTVAVTAGSIVTSPANQNVTLTVYNASGTSVGSITNATGSLTVNLTNLAAGTYHVLVVPYYAASATLQMTLGSGTGTALGMDGTTASYTTSVPGEIGYFTFAGVAGQNVGLGVTGLTFTPSTTSSASLYVYKPDNTYLNSVSCYASNPGGGCQLALTNLPVSGTYMVKLTPPGQQVMTFNFTASQDVTGTLALNSAQGVTLVPGQDTWLDFTATAGQTLAVSASSIVTSPANQNVTLTVYNASGASVGTITNATGSLTVNLTNLAAGTYHVLVMPYYAASATLQVTLGAGTGAALGMDGSTAHYTASVPGEIGYFTFAGVAGQSVGLGVTGLTFTPSTTSSASLYVYKPDNTYLNSTSCYTASPGGGCQLALTNLPVSGTYTVKLTPPGQQVMNFNFTASQDVTGTLALNSAQGVTLVSGQDTWFDFTATAGQTVAVSASSIVTSPASQNVTLTVYNASGASVGTITNATGSLTVNLTNLAAGTYHVLVVPYYAASATLQVGIH